MSKKDQCLKIEKKKSMFLSYRITPLRTFKSAKIIGNNYRSIFFQRESFEMEGKKEWAQMQHSLWEMEEFQVQKQSSFNERELRWFWHREVEDVVGNWNSVLKPSHNDPG